MYRKSDQLILYRGIRELNIEPKLGLRSEHVKLNREPLHPTQQAFVSDYKQIHL